MSIISKIMETVVQYMPDKKADELIHNKKYVGQPINRVDGYLKVTGEATFSAEYEIENLAYAALVYSTIAKGKIASFDLTEVKKAEGVIDIITYENAPKLNKPIMFNPGGKSKGSAASKLPVFQDNEVYWDGQPIAVVVAETLEQAEHGVTLVKVNYNIENADILFAEHKDEAVTPKDILGEPPEIKIGEAADELARAEFKVDNTYCTPRYNHNPIEPHASIAMWKENDELVIFDATQHVYGVKNTLAEIFSIKPEKVQAISPFVGGGFGSKGTMWTNTILCTIAAKVTGRPVKLALSREGMYRITGGRTLSEQRVAIGTNKDGKFISIIHQGITATTEHNMFPEQFTFPVRHLYSSPNFLIGQKVVLLNTVANTFMRAPGESIGTFALESAIDELAHKMKLDPIELRKINEPEKDPTKETPFSNRNLIEAYKRGAEKFNWKHREPKSQCDGEWLIGQGVATAYYPYFRFPATAKILLYADGKAIIKAAAHEMGMGTATVQIQHAADRLGLPIENISFHYGDSNLPEASFAGGSNQTASIVAGVKAAADKLLKEIFDLAIKDKNSPLSKYKFEELEAKNSGLYNKNGVAAGESFTDILKRSEKDYLEIEATSDMPMELQKYSMGSYGAQFAEVRVNESTGEVRVSRWLGSFDAGTILNPKTAISQFQGGIIMGIGMALTEETFFDERRGRIVNPSLAEYHVPVNLDIPKIEIIYNDIPDEHSPLGGHGIGEIGITGAAAAIANAVFNATGVRVRDLPITLDKLFMNLV